MRNDLRDLEADEAYEMTRDERDLSEEFGFRSDAGRQAFIEGRHGRSLFAGENVNVDECLAQLRGGQRYEGQLPERYDDGRLIRPGTGHRETGHLSPAVRQLQEEVARLERRLTGGDVLLREKGGPPNVLRTDADGKVVDDRACPSGNFTAADFEGKTAKQIAKMLKKARKAEEAANPLYELGAVVMGGDEATSESRRRARIFVEGRNAA